MKNCLIVFSGKAQAGKSTCSQVLQKIVEEDGLVFKKLSFATALKEIAERYFKWDGDKGIYYNKTSETKKAYNGMPNYVDTFTPVPDKGRQLLINIGQHFRVIRPTIWADIVYDEMIEFEKNNARNVVFCLDDLRFRNEIDMVKKYSRSTLVRVIRDGQLDIDDISEKDCDNVKFDNIINNNGTLEDLARSVSEIYKIAKTGN